MASYTFDSLSPLEFTEMVRDLLHLELGVPLSVSPEGPDGGIDILFAGRKNSYEIVIQCKHYKKSTLSSLLASLKKELPKIRKLRPERYIIATQHSLSVGRKRELLSLFSPWIQTIDDIFGQDDLNALLRKYSDVEQRHYKLWLTSSAVLEEILLHGTSTWRAFATSEIKSKHRLYVQTPSFQRGLQLLNENNAIIISGSAGIGKTTLAQALVAKHIEQGYRLLDLDSLSNIKAKLPLNSKCILYYDDFLGSSVFQDKLGKNEDARLNELIEFMRRSSNVRGIFTTREYLLQQARDHYEKLNAPAFSNQKIILELSDYSIESRGRILCNHLFFNDISLEDCRSLLGGERLKKIVEHANFVPRIVEWCTNRTMLPEFSNGNYADFLLKTLDHPQELYRFAIDSQLSRSARRLLYVLLSKHSDDLVASLKLSWLKLQENSGEAANDREFKKAYREVEGSFTKQTPSYNDDGDRIRFSNPGVRDSVVEDLRSRQTELDMLLQSAEFPSQLVSWARTNSLAVFNPIHPEALEMPPSWYERWNCLVRNQQADTKLLYEAFVDSIDLTVWYGKSDLAFELFQKITNRIFDEGRESQTKWSALGNPAIDDSLMAKLSSCAWLSDNLEAQFRESAYKIHAYDLVEEHEALGHLGDLSVAARTILTTEAQRRVESFLTEYYVKGTFDEDEGDQNLPSDSDLDDMEHLSQNLHLSRADELTPLRQALYDRQDSSQQSVSSRVLNPNNQQFALVKAMFDNLIKSLE